jgi:hypothetical protein
MKNSMMILASALVLVASSNNAQAMDSTQQLAVTGGAAVAGCVAGTVISLASKKFGEAGQASRFFLIVARIDQGLSKALLRRGR